MTAPSAAAREPVIDAHLHLWDLAVGDYAWLPKGSPLHATYTAGHAHAELTEAGVDAAILVQAEDSERDTEFLLARAGEHDWLAGVVGWVRLDDPATARGQLERFSESPALCGIRHLVHDDPRADFLELPAVRESLAVLAERGLPFDVPDAWPRHLRAIADLAAALPNLTIVVDHLGKPPRSPDDLARWQHALRDVAARPNTVAKVSGLQLDGHPFTADAVRAAWHTALRHFGPERLMYGGDWPMTVPHGGYRQAWRVAQELLTDLSPSERRNLLSTTASRVYRVPEPAR